LFSFDAGLFRDAFADRLRDVRRKAEQVAGDNDAAMALCVFEYHRLDVEIGCDFLERLGASAVARHDDRHLRRDLHFSEADLPRRVAGEDGNAG